MSHVTLSEAETADQQIQDIKALQAAAARCGLEFREGQDTFRSWADDNGGQMFGDWPLPEGYKTIEELQAATKHAIGIPGQKGKGGVTGYEIGVIESRKFPGTYSLAYDFFGDQIDKRAGKGLEDLRMFYHAEAARAEARKQGYQYSEKVLPNGELHVEMDMTMKLGY